MNMQIYYFSGTGNSLHVAQELKRRIPEVTLVPIISALNNEKIKTSAEIIGLVFPLHGYTIPFPVKEFLQQVDLQSASYIFAVATRGGSPCGVFEDVDVILRKKGKSLDAHFYLEMPNNFQLLHFKPVTPEMIRENELELQRRLASIQAIILQKQISRAKDHRKPLPFFKRNILFPLLKWAGQKTRFGHIEKKFYADGKCSGCGMCEQVCLAEKIRLENGRPVWRKDIPCLFCFACINYCPNQAIQLKGSQTSTQGRYHHGEISQAAIAEQKKGL
ncbi:MAG TPA: ferredoxin [Firmicutes bacterium]|jgi:ferredoxin|nr:ferredoxin [Bacillota bacterium]